MPDELEGYRWVPSSPPQFAGRKGELRLAVEELASDARREINVWGDRGIGKTTVLREIAASTAHFFPDGVFFILAAGQFSASPFRLPDISAGRSLVVIDELLPEDMAPLRPTAVAVLGSTEAALLTASERPLSFSDDALHIHLEPLTAAEAYELFSMFAHPATPNRVAQNELFQFFRGHPVGLRMAFELMQERALDTSALINLLSPFRTPGIVDPEGLPLKSSDQRLRNIVEKVIEVDDELISALATNPSLMYQLEPRKFEELVAELLERQGFEVHVTPATNDGGRDIFAASHGVLGQFLYFVECKRYAAHKPVSVGVVRQLHGVVQAHQATAGIVVTSSYFSRHARRFQEQVPHQLSLRDYLAVSEWLGRARNDGRFRGGRIPGN